MERKLPRSQEITRVSIQQNNNNWIVDQWRKGIYCDVRIHATANPEPAGADPGSQPIQAHKLFLANASPYFAKTFFGSEGPSRDEFVVNGIDRATLFYLIKYIYTKTIEPLNDGSALKILRGAKKLELEPVVRECKRFIQSLTEHPLEDKGISPSPETPAGSSRDSYKIPDQLEQTRTPSVSTQPLEPPRNLSQRATRGVRCPKEGEAGGPKLVPSKRKGQRSESVTRKKQSQLSGPDSMDLPSSSSAVDNMASHSRRSIPSGPNPLKGGSTVMYFFCKDTNSNTGKLMSFDFQTGRIDQLTTYSTLPRNCMVYHGGNIYDIGGHDPQKPLFRGRDRSSSQVKIFNIDQKKWLDGVPPMRERRSDFSSVVLGKFVYAVGGCNGSWGSINCVERLPLLGSVETKDWKWKETDFLKRSTEQSGICTYNGKIYSVGGYVACSGEFWADMKASNVVVCYDPLTDHWSEMCPMPTKRLGLAVAVVGSRLYALGGGMSHNSKKLKTVEVYNFENDSWVPDPQSPAPASMKKARGFFSVVVLNNEIYAIGGDEDDKPTMEKFSIPINKWTMLDAKLPPGGNYDAAAFNTGE